MLAAAKHGERPMIGPKDEYDAAYERGYADGLEGRPPSPPDTDAEVNYRDGFADGDFARREADLPRRARVAHGVRPGDPPRLGYHDAIARALEL